jgi:hypothetical protein
VNGDPYRTRRQVNRRLHDRLEVGLGTDPGQEQVRWWR